MFKYILIIFTFITEYFLYLNTNLTSYLYINIPLLYFLYLTFIDIKTKELTSLQVGILTLFTVPIPFLINYNIPHIIEICLLSPIFIFLVRQFGASYYNAEVLGEADITAFFLTFSLVNFYTFIALIPSIIIYKLFNKEEKFIPFFPILYLSISFGFILFNYFNIF